MRVQTDTYNVYKFDELSDDAKERARNWFKETDDFSFHAELVMEDAKECAKLLGINIEKIYYSGFWSQGDGACFIGNFEHDTNAIQNLKKYSPDDQRLQDIAILLNLCSNVTASISHRGHYYHSGCMDIDVQPIDDDFDTDSEEDILKDALKSFADWIYRRLEKEYEYQNSNEVIDENILINEYEFLENGTLA